MEFLGFFEYFSVLKHVLEFLEIVFALKIFLEKNNKNLSYLSRASTKAQPASRRPNSAGPTPSLLRPNQARCDAPGFRPG
jgi:hypothetical protein